MKLADRTHNGFETARLQPLRKRRKSLKKSKHPSVAKAKFIESQDSARLKSRPDTKHDHEITLGTIHRAIAFQNISRSR